MKYKELQNKTEVDLQKDLTALKDQIQKLALKIRMGESKNHQEVKKLKRDAARILTKISEVTLLK